MTQVEGFVSANPDLTLTINHSNLELTTTGDETLDTRIVDGSAKIDGDPTVLGHPALSVLSQATVNLDPIFEVSLESGNHTTKLRPETN